MLSSILAQMPQILYNMHMNQNPLIGIIGGRGRMGAYFADYFKKAGYKVIVSDRKTKLTNKELAAQADIVIISVPIGITEKIIKEVAPLIKKEGAIMDLTSLKEFPVKAMLKAKCEVIGLHPLFSHTNPLPGQTVIACPVRSKIWYPRIKQFLEERGAKVTELSPKEHDKIMAVIQALVHFADIAFGHALKSIKIPINDYLKYATPSSELKIAFAARLLEQDPDLYANIQIQNPQTKKILGQYLKSIEKLLLIDTKKDIKAFKKYFASASEYLRGYKTKAFDDTNYLIYAILERRQRASGVRAKKNRIHMGGKKHELAVLGPKFTFSDLAASLYQNTHAGKTKPVYAYTISDVFDLVSHGKCIRAIVPLENLINGTVRETYDALFEEQVYIEEKFFLPIKHSLVSLSGVKAKDIDTVASHSQALGQCKKYLNKEFKSVNLVAAPSTLAAYEKMKGENDRHTAVIIPAKAADLLNCNVIAEDIGDSKANKTSFIVIKKGKAPSKSRTENSETAIAFYFDKDKPGSLLKILQDFATYQINLNKIESRPLKTDPGNYVFFLNFEKGISDKSVQKLLKKIEQKVSKLKILGSYPVT